MTLNIASDLQTHQTVWVVTGSNGKQHEWHGSAVEVAGLVQQSAYDRHGVVSNPRCPISGWRTSNWG